MTLAEIRHRIDQQVPAAEREHLAQVIRLAEARGWPLYLVGGFVRDLLLGLRPDDFDMVSEGDAAALARAAASEWGGDVVVHAPFGTAAWIAPDGIEIDFATARTETYPRPAALPSVRTPAPIAADLQRRDFTINALALRLDSAHFGQLLDFYGGQIDLAARWVRVLHGRSFQDDPTRLFRAVRYEQRLGFQIAPDTLGLFPEAWEALAALSSDRVRNELTLVFREPRAAAMLARLDELGVLAHVHPALAWDGAAAEEAAEIGQLPATEWRLGAPPDLEPLYLALMLRRAQAADVEAALIRLNVSRAAGQAVREALSLQRAWSRPSQAVAVLDRLSEPGLLSAYVARPALRPDLNDYLARWRFVRAVTTGNDLIARGLTPGPHFKDLLWALRAARLDGEIADAAGEARLISRWLTRA